jgi:L-ribulose-5-phosphate 3-epimerase
MPTARNNKQGLRLSDDIGNRCRRLNGRRACKRQTNSALLMNEMHYGSLTDRLAVCSWSLQPTGPQDLIDKLRGTGVRSLQLALDPLRESPKIWHDSETLFRSHGVKVISGMLVCVGEDYSTMESIRLTGGIAPDHTWEENLANFRAGAALAVKFGIKLVTFHAGFLPSDSSDPAFKKMWQRLKAIADIFKAHNLLAGLETGQETAPELAELLRQINHPSLCVNFDPANMISYAKGDPVKALQTLAPWIRHVHIKDAMATKVPGTWGREVPVGTGEVDWRAFFAALKQSTGHMPLAIEREAGSERVADIRAARLVVEQNYI